jgi:3-deoxy-D-manno-octulosonic-acid transferase
MRWIYTIGIFVYVFSIKLAAFFGNIKAGKWVAGRKGLYSQYKMLFFADTPGSFFWFHVSSLGEFEQGRPVIEAIRKNFPERKILLTFFSPSGYEIRKDNELADIVLYLPIDCLRLMRKFVGVVQPCAVIFVKYDFWFNFITACSERKIPVFFISAVFRKNHFFFRWWAQWFRKQLQKVDTFFVQTHESLIIAQKNGLNNITFAGDTRLDRVIEIRNDFRKFPEINQFINGRKVLLAGSTWPSDERFIIPWINANKNICLIIAPHDVSETRLKEIESTFENPVKRYSSLQNTYSYDDRILLIDTIGILAYLYREAYVALIGNGFGKGIHNILEPVVFGKPVVFGPHYHHFAEAVSLIAGKGAFSFKHQEELNQYLNRLMFDSEFYRSTSEACLKYVSENSGATQRIMGVFQRKFNT